MRKGSSLVLALGTEQGVLERDGTVPPSLCHQRFTWPSSSPALTENRRGPSEKSMLEGMGCTEGPKPVPHMENSSRQVDCLSARKWRGHLGKGLREEGRSLPWVPEEPLVFLSAEASAKHASSAPSPKDNLSVSCRRADLLSSHLLEPLNSWTVKINIKNKVSYILYRGFKSTDKYNRQIK